ncbi:MAG: hypothetical protein EZS28_021783 [Streblomastix strix]|uniref:AAR2 protein n=1 Tax=Streblomastix strix TaxID=222440 RepID=A0A5J4VJF5_9EUKA|nr:MAG: hypothetical protein EZS28_021783 [Streblomastix strix]
MINNQHHSFIKGDTFLNTKSSSDLPAALIVIGVENRVLQFGMDMNYWITNGRFKGVGDIPPGVHYIHYRQIDIKNQSQHNSFTLSFFHIFKPGDKEDVEKKQRWDELTSCIDNDLIQQLTPVCGFIDPCAEQLVGISNIKTKDLNNFNSYERKAFDRLHDQYFTNMSESDNQQSEEMECDPFTFLVSPTAYQMYKSQEFGVNVEQSGEQIQKIALICKLEQENTEMRQILEEEQLEQEDDDDELINISQYQADSITNECERNIGEFQFAFLAFSIGQSYTSLIHWKRLFHMLCTSNPNIQTDNSIQTIHPINVNILLQYPNLAILFLHTIHQHIEMWKDDEIGGDYNSDLNEYEEVNNNVSKDQQLKLAQSKSEKIGISNQDSEDENESTEDYSDDLRFAQGQFKDDINSEDDEFQELNDELTEQFDAFNMLPNLNDDEDVTNDDEDKPIIVSEDELAYFGLSYNDEGRRSPL